METQLSSRKSGQGCGSRVVSGGWSVVVVRIQCFSFGLRGEVIG
jgi:hypothetical protein